MASVMGDLRSISGGRQLFGRCWAEHIWSQLVACDDTGRGLLYGQAVVCGHPLLPKPAGDRLRPLLANPSQLSLSGWNKGINSALDYVHGR